MPRKPAAQLLFATMSLTNSFVPKRRDRRETLWLFLAIAILMLCFPARTAHAQQQVSIILTEAPLDTGISITQGQSVTIRASGVMNWFTGSCNNECLSAPNGEACPYTMYAPSLPCWSLIGRIGNGAPFEVGDYLQITNAPAGELYLGVNDNPEDYLDNTGSWIATIDQGAKQQGDCGCNTADPGMAAANPQDFGSPGDGSGAGQSTRWVSAQEAAEMRADLGFRLLNSPAGNGARRRAVFSGFPSYSINRATGNLFYTVTDYSTAGQNPLAFVRYYNSRADVSGAPTMAGSMGALWRTNYDRYLQISATSVVAERADGQQLNFTLKGGVWTPTPTLT